MGNVTSTTSIFHPTEKKSVQSNKLSQQETYLALEAFGFNILKTEEAESVKHLKNELSRNYSKSSSLKNSITLTDFIQHFPLIIQPFVTRLLCSTQNQSARFRTNAKKHFCLTNENLLEIVSLWIDSKTDVLEELIINGDLSAGNTIFEAFDHLLTFSYLLSLYLLYPLSRLFVDSDAFDNFNTKENELMKNKTSSQKHLMSKSTFRKSLNVKYHLKKLTSWDTVTKEYRKLQKQILASPQRLKFTSLTASFEEYYASREVASKKTKRFSEHEIILDWLDANIPCLKFSLRAALKHALLYANNNDDLETLDKEEDEKQLPKHSDSVISQQNSSCGWRGFFLASTSRCMTDELCYVLRQTTSRLSRADRWCMVYASWKHGRSINRVASTVMNYPGDTMLIVKTETSHVFGVFIDSEWRETHGKFFGSSNTFMWTFLPKFKIFRATGNSKHFVYFNSKNSFYPKGIGFGGQVSSFRLWLPHDFVGAYTIPFDNTYEPGNLCDEVSTDVSADMIQKFVIHEYEIWSTGLADDLEAQHNAQERDDHFRLSRKQFDRKKFFQNEFNRQYLLGDAAR